MFDLIDIFQINWTTLPTEKKKHLKSPEKFQFDVRVD